MKSLPPGGTIDVHDANGALLGRGYANPAALIAVRLLSTHRDDIDHPAFWAARVRSAVAYRRLVYPDRVSLRLVDGEADRLPGLTVDAYGDFLVVQLSTVGAESRRELIRQALEQAIEPRAMVLCSTGKARRLEGLEDERRVWVGDAPEHVDISEYGVRFRVSLNADERRHYYDRTDNRVFAAPLCRGRSVLDVYAHGAGWALHALANGATRAIAVDKFEPHARAMMTNAELNGLGDRLEVWQGEGKAALQELVADSARFGMVVLDPPPFAKTRKAAGSALRGYREINALAMILVEPGGLLFTSTCSPHVQHDRFVAELQAAAKLADRTIRVVRTGAQSADHPTVPAIPETRVLSHLALQLVPAV